jgi:hypothetical protein
MHGSLSLRHGVLYVGRHVETAHVRPYDLDGLPLGPGFSFRGQRGGPARVAGIDADGDHRLWIADPLAPGVRIFNLFGREVGGFPSGTSRAAGGGQGQLADLVDLCLLDTPEEDLLLTLQGGERRHAAQVFRSDGQWVASLCPRGEAQGCFRGLRRAASRGRLAWLCEAGGSCVQVFRDHEFHFLFKVPMRPGGRFEPSAIAPLSDGRLVLATGGPDSALLLLDGSGRLLRVLATAGQGAGSVHDPEDLAVEEEGPEGTARLAVIDHDGERVQVFTIEGQCHGALPELPGEAL